MHFSKSLVLTACAFPLAVSAQQADSTMKMDSTATPAATAPASGPTGNTGQGTAMQLPPIKFSGTVFGNYMYMTGKSGKGANQFNLERNYLTIMGDLGSRTSFRVTTDLFNNGSSGYDLRMKYAYLQYNYLDGADVKAAARAGIVQTVFIDHEENFWPRWINKTPTELAGFFSSADVGVATMINTSNKMAEVYAAVTNGPGYNKTVDPDRFKDYQARLSLMPLNGSEGILKTLTLTGWYYKGTVADGNATTGSHEGLDNSKWGIFAGLRDPRITLGFDYARAMAGSDTGVAANTPLNRTIDASLWSAYTVLHPLSTPSGNSPFGIVFRYDNVKPNTDLDPGYSLWIAGLTWDITKMASISADIQQFDSRNGFPAASLASVSQVSGISPAPRTANVHWVFKF